MPVWYHYFHQLIISFLPCPWNINVFLSKNPRLVFSCQHQSTKDILLDLINHINTRFYTIVVYHRWHTCCVFFSFWDCFSTVVVQRHIMVSRGHKIQTSLLIWKGCKTPVNWGYIWNPYAWLKLVCYLSSLCILLQTI